MSGEFKAIFEPKSVVLLGTSAGREDGIASPVFFHSLVHNVSRFFKGKVHVVDLGGKLEGAYKKINELPKGCDLAVVILPKETFLKNARKLLDRKIRALIIIAGGFDQKQREELARLVKIKNVCLLGPNAMMGAINTAKGLCAMPEEGLMPKQGHVAVISQDGGVAAAILDWAQSRGVSVSKFACVGDSVSVNEVDLLEYLTRDKETKAISIYVKRIQNGRKFINAIREAVKQKPVVLLKGGRERVAERDEIFATSLKQVGAIRALDIEELLNIASGLARQPPMRGKRVAIITNASGPAALAVDAITREGLTLATFSNKVVKKILDKYPSIKVTNSIDLGVEARADRYKFVIEQLLSDQDVDGVMVINLLKSSLLKSEDIRAVAEATKRSKDKPVIDVAVGSGDCALIREALKESSVPVHDLPGKAARVLQALYLYGQTRAMTEK